MKNKQAALKKINLKNPIHCLAVGFGSGLLSPAPGTWGTLLGWLIGLTTLALFNSWILIIFTILGIVFGSYICGKTADDMGVHDHGAIVWDEIVAIWLILLFIPEYTALWTILALLFFRLFDITKPYPIKYFDQSLHNGWGIMVDDLLAAVYTLMTLYGLSLIF